MCYAAGQTLEKSQIAEHGLVEILKQHHLEYILEFKNKFLSNFISLIVFNIINFCCFISAHFLRTKHRSSLCNHSMLLLRL